MASSSSNSEPPRNTQRLTKEDTSVAGGLIAAGKLVVIPTETVYGLAAAVTDPQAVAAIFRAKGRPQDNPLIVHLASVAEAQTVVPPELTTARRLLEAFSPGPITVVVPAPAWVPPVVTGGLSTVAIRVPAHPVAQQIITAAGVPVAAPSANRSGRPSPTTAEMAWHELAGRVDAVVGGGVADGGIESTVVDATKEGELRILRPGLISAADLRRRLECPVHASGSLDQTERTRSPGTRYRHYRPRLPVYLCQANEVDEMLSSLPLKGRSLWLILGPAEECERSVAEFEPSLPVRVWRMASWGEYSHRLYRTFWEAERAAAALIVAQIPAPGTAEGLADRLERAAEGSWRSVQP